MERSNCCRSGGGGFTGGRSSSSSSSSSSGGTWCLFVRFVDGNFRLSHGVDDAGRLLLTAGDVGEGDGLLLHRLGERSLLEHWSGRGVLKIKLSFPLLGSTTYYGTTQ